jgi:hypothetical protein
MPQTYSESVRPSSIVKQLKPESALPPRTLLETSVKLVSVEEMRLCSEVSKTAVPEGSAAPRVGCAAGVAPNRELIKVATPINAEAIACSMPHMVRRLRAL